MKNENSNNIVGRNQNLFNTLQSVCNFIALESDMDEILRAVEKDNKEQSAKEREKVSVPTDEEIKKLCKNYGESLTDEAILAEGMKEMRDQLAPKFAALKEENEALKGQKTYSFVSVRCKDCDGASRYQNQKPCSTCQSTGKMNVLTTPQDQRIAELEDRLEKGELLEKRHQMLLEKARVKMINVANHNHSEDGLKTLANEIYQHLLKLPNS